MSKTVIRGEIQDRNGVVLARTDVNEEGEETRVYPFGSVFAHPIGYSTKGTTEIENTANYYLLTSNINRKDKFYNELLEQKSPGDNVVTTLDANLQQFCYDALGDKKGAIVVMEPKTGKILAMVSKPTFDPNTLNENWESLISDDNTDASLLNRATQGQYPPGSTFKVLTDLAYIRENPDTYQDFLYDCRGSLTIGDYTLNCHEGEVHGVVNTRSALSLSCNGAFATMGLSLNIDKWKEICEDFMFNTSIPINIESKKSSFVVDENSSTSEIMQSAIGQGKTIETPLHNLMITSSVANDGVMMKPYLIDRVVSAQGDVVESFEPEALRTLMTVEETDILTDYMTAVVAEGSGYRAGSEYAQVAGKTGTAEYNSSGDRHAWFTGFAPNDDPEIAVTIILEDSGSGGENAAPVAKTIFDYYFANK